MNTTLPTPTNYSEDEVLIFGGKFADQFASVFFSKLGADHHDSVRNAVADAVEKVMKGYKGRASVPLPKDLLDAMDSVADVIARSTLAALVEPMGGGGF